MVSICIPTSDMIGRNVEFLTDLINSIERQDYKDIEIVISDNSSGPEINFLWVNSFPSAKYFRNQGPNTAAANINNAIRNATGDIIKPMFCDDYFIQPDTISKFVKALDTSHWAFCSSFHKESGRDDHIPFINHDLIGHHFGLAEGNNTYGCPSAMAFKKTDITFDEKLRWLLDCEFYTRMQIKYGPPSFVDSFVNIREWEGQETKKITGSMVIQEREYVSNKFRK